MKRFLRALADFLERKFPDKVVVTAESYARLQGAQAALEALNKKHDEEIVELKRQIANINIAVGFATPKVGILER